MNIIELRKKAATLPLSPGVYIMKNRDGNIIYVGKSKALKNRVSQYFNDTDKHSIKTAKMVSRVCDFDYILTETEIEALALENKLIKLHKPKFNIRLKDSKSYPYIALTSNDEYPRVYVTRTRKKDGSEYFGPYTGVFGAYTILNTAFTAFGIPNCKHVFPRDIGKVRPCIYYEMGRCPAICSGQVSSEEYKERLQELRPFLRGNYSGVKEALKKKMQYASDNFRYEAAAKYRDAYQALDKLRERQKIVGKPGTDYDLFSLYDGDTASCLVCFSVRDGAVHDSENYIFGAAEIPDADGIVSCISNIYEKREYIPDSIYLGFDIGEDLDILSAYIYDKTGHEPEIKIPKKGDVFAVAKTADENAKQHIKEYEARISADNEILVKLASILRLEVLPEKIEAYDISNLGNENITGGMIALRNGRFSKSEYRVYKMKTVSTEDDYASMQETVRRRFSHPELDFPDLLLIDGGIGHVHSVLEVLSEMNIDIPVFGMVKDEHHKTRALVSDEGEISIAKDQSVFVFVYKIQEEIHRFTVGRMMNAKRKTFKHSGLESIDRIGPAKARALLSHFKTIRAIGEADENEILSVKGISEKDASRIKDYFLKKGETPK